MVPASSDGPVKAPPHPLDGKWHLHLDDAVYGPYTGHEIKSYIEDGRVDGTTNVVRVGQETWTKAVEDPHLGKLFAAATRSPPPLPSITAERGATVVNVTNQIPSNAALAMMEDGEFGPKSAGVALLLSFLLCGAGQMYNGQVAKGFLMLFGCVVLWFMLLGWIIAIWSWIDAYQTAKKMNARYMRRLAAGMPV